MRLSKLVSLLSLALLARADDVTTIYQRQVDFILSTTTPSSNTIQGYISTLLPNGTWKAINYKAGCGSQRSSWPAGGHWQRILEMAAAYTAASSPQHNSPALRTAIRSAMGFWFANDYTEPACMDREFYPNGMTLCNCSPGLWGENWYSNTIQVPTRSGKACTLLIPSLTPSELAHCTLIASRAYAPFFRNPQPGYVSGANIIDMAVIGISAGLLENNASRITDAYRRVHAQVSVQQADRVDGIKPDGSFQQHTGIIYDGNYGKDFSNSLIELELQALGTQFQAPKSVQDVFGLHLGGARWMTFTNVLKGVVHWDMTVIGRYVSYPVADFRASANLGMDLDQVLQLGRAWNQPDLIRFGTELTGEDDETANSGNLLGTRVFWSSDYIVHRTETAVTTLKMLSTRTRTSECVNSESPFAFHLSDGVTYTYSTGAEYEDMYATLDWNIPPGITTDYKNTALGCSTTARQGVDAYAGGVVGKSAGMGAMRYVNPLTRSLSFYKAWFFFPETVQHVLVSNVRSNSQVPVYSVLDQRLRSGNVYVNGNTLSSNGNSTNNEVRTLWHAGTGYAFTLPQRVTVKLETKTGKWSDISLSSQPPSTKNMFTAWVEHTRSSYSIAPTEYSIFPATTSNAAFESKASSMRPRTVVNSAGVSAAMDAHALILGAAFWVSSGGGVTINEMGIRIEVDRGVVLMLEFDDASRRTGRVSVAEPTHGTGSVTVRISWVSDMGGSEEMCAGGEQCVFGPEVGYTYLQESVMTLTLPKGGMAGSTVSGQFRKSGY